MDINRASEKQLEQIDRIGGTRARHLIEYRTEHGGFRSWEEVKRVPSYEDGMVEQLQRAGFTIGQPRRPTQPGSVQRSRME